MLDSLKGTFSTVGETTTGYARRFGCSTRALARRIGPRRGIAALVILAAGVGTAFLVRYLRNRRDEMELEDLEEPVEGVRIRRRRRKIRHHEVTVHQPA
jgi:hypothetical protein